MEILPIVLRNPKFALKGGTAINLFIRELPRLSVDIDLTYLPIAPRAETIADINNALREASIDIKNAVPGSVVKPTKPFDSGKEIKILVEVNNTIVKIEPNYILRGTVFAPSERSLSQQCREHFGVSITANVSSIEDIYAGKICAALDRQHPRDLFDIHLLLENEGITPKIRQTFLVYLMSHNRPMNELLRPNWQDLTALYSTEFMGMSAINLTIEQLQNAGRRLIATILHDLTNFERNFLLKFKQGQADWSLFFNPQVQFFPGILWKQKNLQKITLEKRKVLVDKLENILF